MYACDDNQLHLPEVSIMNCTSHLAMLTLFFLATSFRYDTTSQLAVLSRPLVGSSKNNIFGPVIREAE